VTDLKLPSEAIEAALRRIVTAWQPIPDRKEAVMPTEAYMGTLETEKAMSAKISKDRARAYDFLDKRNVPRFAPEKDAEGRLIEYDLSERLEIAFGRTVHLPWYALRAWRARVRHRKSSFIRGPADRIERKL